MDAFGEIRAEWVLEHEARKIESAVGERAKAAANIAEPVIDAAGRVGKSTLEGTAGGAIDGAAVGGVLGGPAGILPGAKAGAMKGAVESFSKSVVEEIYRAISPESSAAPEEQATDSSAQPEEDGPRVP